MLELAIQDFRNSKRTATPRERRSGLLRLRRIACAAALAAASVAGCAGDPACWTSERIETALVATWEATAGRQTSPSTVPRFAPAGYGSAARALRPAELRRLAKQIDSGTLGTPRARALVAALGSRWGDALAALADSAGPSAAIDRAALLLLRGRATSDPLDAARALEELDRIDVPEAEHNRGVARRALGLPEPGMGAGSRNAASAD
jgi:hypothetical protein